VSDGLKLVVALLLTLLTMGLVTADTMLVQADIANLSNSINELAVQVDSLPTE
jgi:hypothetical protein